MAEDEPKINKMQEVDSRLMLAKSGIDYRLYGSYSGSFAKMKDVLDSVYLAALREGLSMAAKIAEGSFDEVEVILPSGGKVPLVDPKIRLGVSITDTRQS